MNTFSCAQRKLCLSPNEINSLGSIGLKGGWKLFVAMFKRHNFHSNKTDTPSEFFPRFFICIQKLISSILRAFLCMNIALFPFYHAEPTFSHCHPMNTMNLVYSLRFQREITNTLWRPMVINQTITAAHKTPNRAQNALTKTWCNKNA